MSTSTIPSAILFGFLLINPSVWSQQPTRETLTEAERKQLEPRGKLAQESEQLAREGKLVEAIAACQKLLALQRSVLGPEHADVVASLGHLADLQEHNEEFAPAEKSRLEVLALQKKRLASDDWRVTDARLALENLAALARMDAKARMELKDAYQSMEEAVSHGKSANYQEGKKDVEKALAIRKRLLGDNNLETAASLSELSHFLWVQGDYAAAQGYLEQRWPSAEKYWEIRTPRPPWPRKDWACCYPAQCDYAAARPCYEQALAIFKRAYGDNHPDTARALSEMGILLFEQGDYAAARPYYDQALAIRKSVLGDEDPETVGSLSELGILLFEQGDYAAARPYYDQALAINKKVLGDNHPDTAASLSELGLFHFAQEDYAAARPYYDQALVIWKKVHGDNHPDTALTLRNLGLLLSAQGDYAAARAHLEQAVAIDKKVLGDNHPRSASSLGDLGMQLFLEGDYKSARANLENALSISRRNLNLSAAGQSERQQLLMAQMLRQELDRFLSVPATGEAALASDYAHVLAWFGSTEVAQRRMRLARVDSQLAPLFQKLQSTAEALATLSASMPADAKDQPAWTKQRDELSERQEQLQRELAAKSAVFQSGTSQLDLTPNELLKVMPADTALVDFLVYCHHQPDLTKKGKWLDEQRLTVFVLRPGAAVVRLELGPIAPIEKAIDSWRLVIGQQSRKDHPGMELRRRLWQPLEKHLVGAKTVLISPDGALGRLPFAALPGAKEGSYLLEEIALAVVPVPRMLPELLRHDPAALQDTPPSLLLVGDVNFDASPRAGGAGQSSRAPTRAGNFHAWSPLEHTRGEIVAIGDSFKRKNRKGQVTELREEEATDSEVGKELGQHRFVHIATHGFFAAAEVRSAVTGVEGHRGAAGGDSSGVHGGNGFHPGLLSGLVLSGANNPPEPGRSDGILTALEVAELDLTKVELAVLSACETGLGKVAGGEGILGLQRSFQVAGARSVVATLWNVPDKSARILMERFYANLWHKTRPMSKLEALRDAQLWVLNNEKEYRSTRLKPKAAEPENLRTPPEYWAAFVLSGDWR